MSAKSTTHGFNLWKPVQSECEQLWTRQKLTGSDYKSLPTDDLRWISSGCHQVGSQIGHSKLCQCLVGSHMVTSSLTSPHSLTPLPLSHLSTCFCLLIYKAAGHLALHLSPQGRNNGSRFTDKISAVKHPTLFFALRCSKHHLLCWSDQDMGTTVYMYIAFKKKCSLMAGLTYLAIH